MLFKSPHAAQVFKIRSAMVTERSAMGEPLATRSAVRAEFGQFGPEQAVLNPITGQMEQFAEIIGHFFDTDEWYEQRLASMPMPDDPAEIAKCQEEKAFMERILLQKCQSVPSMISQVEKVTVPAPIPWASYGSQTPEQIVDAAQLLELVPEAVQYEKEHDRRPAVLDVLEPLLAGLSADRVSAAVPGEAYPEGAFDVAPSQGVTVGAPQPRTDGGIMSGGPNITIA
jgi:hypothetical protein